MAKRVWEWILGLLYRIGSEPDDSEDIRIQKAVLVGASLLGPAFGLVFIPYNYLIHPLASLIVLIWAIIAMLNLYIFHRTRGVPRFRFVLLTSILFFPFIESMRLGGFIGSSANILWAFIAPLLAIMTMELEKATRWFYAYIGLVILAAFVEPLVSPGTIANTLTITFGFVLNLSLAGVLSYVFLRYFVNQKNIANNLLAQEQEKSENLLLNILPVEIAATLKEKQGVIADHYENASILFADIVGFTPLSEQLTPVEMVDLLNNVYSYFDSLVDKLGLEKIRTIGDNYMVASGVPRSRPDHAMAIAELALEMLDFGKAVSQPNSEKIQLRIGINSGSVVAGVIGQKKFQYDIWGVAVNLASRMESQGEAGKIQVTQETYDLLKNDINFKSRGSLDVKGRGKMATWFLLAKKF